MKFVDYLNKCLENPEFKKYWEEDVKNINFDSFESEKTLSVAEALEVLADEDPNDTLINKGIKKNTKYSTEIIFFEKNEKCPVYDLLNDIKNEKLKEKTLFNISLLATQGSNAKPPLSKYIRHGIYELRSKQGSNATRVFYFFIYGNKIILTNGYIKKDQKLNEHEFKKAERCMEIYLKENNKYAFN